MVFDFIYSNYVGLLSCSLPSPALGGIGSEAQGTNCLVAGCEGSARCQNRTCRLFSCSLTSYVIRSCFWFCRILGDVKRILRGRFNLCLPTPFRQISAPGCSSADCLCACFMQGNGTLFIYIYIYTHTHTHIYIYIYIYAHVYIHACMHAYIHTYTYILVYYVYIYIYIYLFIFTNIIYIYIYMIYV